MDDVEDNEDDALDPEDDTEDEDTDESEVDYETFRGEVMVALDAGEDTSNGEDMDDVEDNEDDALDPEDDTEDEDTDESEVDYETFRGEVMAALDAGEDASNGEDMDDVEDN